ncbi:stigma-specific STIG1-like protein 1 [Carica papaya]|uniref:stigma-specific STIG1-like protein 1 n=1 Tax=Carica papaya TaxID=3649 RepID=UPI000B8C9ECD|nr:stigma-specific STIG1-like protein 1 [Carica papaya]
MQSIRFSVVLFTLFVAVAATSTFSVQLPKVDSFNNINDSNLDSLDDQEPAFFEKTTRILARRNRPAIMTCNNYPKICRLKGSSGSNCCKKRCVNVLTDKLNCGKCGKKCKFSEICCKGKCVNPMFHRKNCGGCSNKCKKGSSCLYGMCSYAN